MASNNKTSTLVSSQLPSYVRSDHPKFVEFIQAYYRFMEQDEEVLDETKNFNQDLDIDRSYGTFEDKLYENFLKTFPQTLVVDRKIVLKHAKDFFRSKGTEKSIRFLMRIMFNKDVTFYYPKNDILRASAGNWVVEKSIRIIEPTVSNTSNSTALTKFTSHEIYGAESNASAKVERTESYYGVNEVITELILSNQKNQFFPGEKVFTFYRESPDSQDIYISANILSGYVESTYIKNGGSGYIENTTIPVEGGGGSGALIKITGTTKGSIKTIGVTFGSSGFQENDEILITANPETLSPARANVLTVDTSGNVSPNSYSVVGSLISLEANTQIGNSVYSNMVSGLVTANANAAMGNTFVYWTYANTGPINQCIVRSNGANYLAVPQLDVKSNVIVRSIGAIGTLSIVNGGQNYLPGDRILLNDNSDYLCLGNGAAAVVTTTNGLFGAITGVYVQAIQGEYAGGCGYEMAHLPFGGANSNSAYGFGANITATGVVADGEVLKAYTDDIGRITEVTILRGGIKYTSEPTLNLKSFGDGTAVVTANIFSGAYTYKGKYVNDDGHLSSYNFMQNGDYYQNFSYVIKIDESTNKYRQIIKDSTHPAGMKMFGEYIVEDETHENMNQIQLKQYYNILPMNTSGLIINLDSFDANSYPGRGNTSNLTFSTESVSNTDHIILTQWAGNSNVAIANGYSLNVNNSIVTASFVDPSSNVVYVTPNVGGSISASKFKVHRNDYWYNTGDFANTGNATFTNTAEYSNTGYYVQFANGNESLVFANNAYFSNKLGTNSFTIITVTKSKDYTYPRSRHPLIVNDNPTTTNEGFGIGEGNTSMFIEIADSSNHYRSVDYPNDAVHDVTYHRAFVVDRTVGANVSYYLNGTLVGTLEAANVTGSIYSDPPTGAIVFGNNAGWRFKGNIYKFLVFDRALTQAEIQLNLNNIRSKYGI